MATMQKITSNLWFDTQAEEAVKFYCSVFKNAKVGRVTYFGNEGFEVHKMPEGSVMTIQFWLEKQEFIALNGGPLFQFNEAVSFIINCEDQEEINYYWEKLSEGGDKNAQQCGWLKDKFGLSWQIVPTILLKMLASTDTERAEKVMKVMLQMKKLEIDKLERAFNKKEMSNA